MRNDGLNAQAENSTRATNIHIYIFFLIIFLVVIWRKLPFMFFLVGMPTDYCFYVHVRITAKLILFVGSQKASWQSAVAASSSEGGGEQWWWSAAKVSSIRQVVVATSSSSQQFGGFQQQQTEAIINIRLRLCQPRLDITMKERGVRVVYQSCYI